MAKQTIRDLDQARGARLFVRVDYNVPLEDGRISDDTRIRASLPTLEHLLKGGARLVLRRSFAKLARKRRRRGMTFGFVGGTMLGGMCTELLPAFLAVLEPFVVFGGMGLGIFAGLQIAKKIHQRQMDEERALLRWLAERVEALVAADRAPKALRP